MFRAVDTQTRDTDTEMHAGARMWEHVPRHTDKLMRDSCKVCWRLRYLPGLGLAIGSCPHPLRLSQTHSGTLCGTHGHANTDPQAHHPPHGAVTYPSRLCPISLNLLVLGHQTVIPVSAPNFPPDSPVSLIPLSPQQISVAVSASLHFSPLWLDFHAYPCLFSCCLGSLPL